MCDCKQPNAIFPSKKRILVIGDLHADWKKTQLLFRKAKLIDINNKWVAEPRDTIVVQVGDQLDGKSRSHNNDAYGEFKILDFLEDIHTQAINYGGGIHSILGNHELMNIMGQYDYVSTKDMEISNGVNGRYNQFKPGGEMACKLACNRNAVIKVGDFVFAHAGIHSKHVNENNFIEKTNKEMYEFITGNRPISKSFQKKFVQDDSILWTRDLGKDSPNCNDVSNTLNKLKVGHIVVGHTPQQNINSRCDNKLWRVDVGISQVFGDNQIQILEILDNGIKKKENNYKPFRILKL